MKIVIADIETNRLENPDKLWIFGGRELDTNELKRFEPWRGQEEKQKAIEWASTVSLWVGHNFLSFDAPNANRLLGHAAIDPRRVIDTLVVSRLIKFDRLVPKGCKSGHSLKAHGIRLGVHKGDFDKFEEYSEEMVSYWEGDISTTEALYNDFKKYIWDKDWAKSLRCEHDLQLELDDQQAYGFAFDKGKAEGLLEQVQADMDVLEKIIQKDYPPQLQEVNRLKYRLKQDGEEFASVQKAKETYPMTSVEDSPDGPELVCYDYVPFNPGSSEQRIEKLWEAGWKPFEKTDTHRRFLRKKVGDSWGKSVTKMDQEFYNKKKEKFEYYGWTCKEDNLATLPAKAPVGAKSLAQWITLEGRRSSLVEWIGQVKDDGRIHGSVMHIGAWTGRCSHSGPNTANISSVWSTKKEPRNEVEKIKKKYDTSLRSCWIVPEDSWLVGVDAEGIQLRILADYLWRHFDAPDYAEAIVNGRKEDETDIHNVNKRSLGINHIERDDAKTFIYAWVLNAGVPKIASILKSDIPVAVSARDRFERSIKGLKPLKEELLPYIADRKWFTGYDGRKVIVPSLHKCLAGILQNGEKVVMAHSRLLAADRLKGDLINWNYVGFIHDENQTEVKGTKEEAEHVKQVQIQAIVDTGVNLGFMCPLAGDGSIGKNWAETH